MAAVVVAVVLCLRDLRLVAGGGGVTPRSLLAFETAAWGTAVLGGAIVLGDPGGDTTRVDMDRLEQWTAAALSVAAVAHGVRLAIYMQKRASS